MDNEELMTVKEVSSWLRLSLAEVYRLIRSKQIASLRVGPGKGAIRLRREDVREFLDRRRTGPANPPAPQRRISALKHIKRK